MLLAYGMGINSAGKDTVNPMSLLRSIAATSYDFWVTAETYQKFAYAIAGLLVASAIFHTGVLVVTNGLLEGPVSWRKPILFGEGFGLTAASVAWVMSYLPKHRTIGWLLMGSLAVANLYEVAWVTVQQWRGVPSHFNFSTPFDAMAFSIAGIMVAVTAMVILLTAIWSFVSLQVRPSLGWAIRFGMVFLLLSQGVGLLIIRNGIAKVIDPETGEFVVQNVGMASIFGAAGSMKIPHALTLHGIQLLPLSAVLLQFSALTESQRTQVVLMAGIGYGGIVAVTLWQTFSGQAFFELTLSVSLLLSLSTLLLLAALLLIGKALHQNSKHAAHFT